MLYYYDYLYDKFEAVVLPGFESCKLVPFGNDTHVMMQFINVEYVLSIIAQIDTVAVIK